MSERRSPITREGETYFHSSVLEAAEADRERLERINARLTKDLADLQRANDHLRWQIKEMHRAALAGEDT